MNRKVILLGICLIVTGCLGTGPAGHNAVPQPAKSVDIKRYSGLWYELARYENGFEKGCEGVTAEYALKPSGEIRVLNTCRVGSPSGPVRTSEGSARIVEGSRNAKLKVSFFGSLYVGDYWILDRASDYSWSIVGEPSGRYLWLLARTPSKAIQSELIGRAKRLGYDTSLLRLTSQ